MMYKIAGIVLVVLAVAGFIAKDYLIEYKDKVAEVVSLSDSDFEEKAESENGEQALLNDSAGGDQFAAATNEIGNVDGTYQNNDGSETEVDIDSYGNKSYTRVFDDHPRVKMLMVKESANGKKQIYVYGQNNKVKFLTKDIPENILRATADQIADSAQIYETAADVERRRLEIAQRKRELRESVREKEMPMPDFPRVQQPMYEQNNEVNENETFEPASEGNKDQQTDFRNEETMEDM